MDRKTFTTTTFSGRYESIKEKLASLKGVALKRGQLNKLNPILVDGILPVGGRLERATILFNAVAKPARFFTPAICKFQLLR